MFCGGGATSENIKTGGQFSFKLYKYHTNAKKPLAVKFALNTFVNIENILAKCLITQQQLMELTIWAAIHLIYVIK